MIDKDYTLTDHLAREIDSYAKYKYDLTIKFLTENGLKKSDRILNIGCGAADFNIQIIRQGFKCDGFDEDEKAIEVGRNRLGSSDSKLKICDISNSLKLFQNYKFFVCHDVIEHIENDEEAFINITKLMRSKDSIIVITVPAFNFLFGIHDVKLGHYRRYTRKQLKSLVDKQLEILECRYVGFLGFFAALIYSRILKKSYPRQNAKSSEFLMKFSTLIERTIGCPFGSSVLLVGKLK
jgi:2-polyprenyl-3-methyl-5-hydroxy-6-metoxy-1,4-benzoquinol methylase